MSEDQIDMSLEALIKAKPSLVKRDRRGGGRGGGRRKSGGGKSASGGGSGAGGRRGGNTRRNPYSRETPAGRWKHDKFSGGNSASGGGGGGGGGYNRGIAKLLISNLEYSVNDQDIRELFSEFGPIRTFSVHYDRSGRSLGTADVTYINRTDAAKAVKTYNNVPLDGKPMLIEMVTDEPASVRRPPVSSRVSNRPAASRMRRGGRGGGRGGRGGGGVKREPKKQMTAEELDKQLDEYKKKA